MTLRAQILLGLALLPAPLAAATHPAEADQTRPDEAVEDAGGEIIVTARRREESLQDVPISLTVVEAARLDQTNTFNIQRFTQLVPSVNFVSSNPRNSSILIRGLGAPFGLTNDGIEQGVGLYIDGVYYSRPAAASFDFVDIERIEVLRGPQGTLYGKNTTAGSINIITRPPAFEPELRAEASVGNYGFLQFKGSVSGPIIADKVAVRLGLSTTFRDGTLTNVLTNQDINSQANIGFRGAVLFTPNDDLKITLAGDYNTQDPVCCGQVFVRVAPTPLRPARNYNALARLSRYAPPSTNPFDRLVDNDSELEARQYFGGAALTFEWDAGPGTLTSITAWRFWDWYPQNDRDFIGLPITTKSQNQSNQDQFTQELRWASSGNNKVDFVAGLFFYRQTILTNNITQQGRSGSLWLLGPTQGANPALLDGLTSTATVDYSNDSFAGFGQLTWNITDSFRIEPGIRLNYDTKSAVYDAVVTGGLKTSDPVLIARKNSILGPQFYDVDFSNFNVSGNLNLAWDVSDAVLAYFNFATAYKSGGINLNGLPTDAAGNPILDAATIEPEQVFQYEVGLKTQFWNQRATLNLAAFWTDIYDYQTTVFNNAFGPARGYLANAGQVRVRGAEFEFNAAATDWLGLTASGIYLDGQYVDFPDAPAPIELTGGPAFVDISGQRLPGISRWSGQLGFDAHPRLAAFGAPGALISGVDVFGRTGFSSSPTPSQYLDVDGYTLVNARLGWAGDNGFQIFAWVRNAFDTQYFDFLTAGPGGTGLIVGQPGDPRTYGLTLAKRF